MSLIGAFVFAQAPISVSNIELSPTQIANICNSVRYKSKGEYYGSGYNYWRYEELILNYMGTTVEHPKAPEKIKTFFDTQYENIRCDGNSVHPEGYLLEQFVSSNFEEAIYDFVIQNNLDLNSLAAIKKATFWEWLESEVSKESITEYSLENYTNVYNDLKTLSEYYPYTPENIARWEEEHGFW